ncbi:uncharacterized protein EKO05_0009220 [Ascochyta rabiei]|uniref:Uncharacterized protein n=1 Tax=Didymella rabiei TaxID=5454 RepID=A0A163ITX3_DIDRA|nr:uncharacterized protein EKO05_0009220 [Ascochyta rabiei]KZM25945.1 hypothetical protein ST47_g3009 [Ascochyta rabiei]UPX18939.1 hypothetical protein EKO05_0009220 [Ascochyta rabiei]
MEHERPTGHDTRLSASPAPAPARHAEQRSNGASWPVAVAETVMAEQVTNHHVVKEAQSVARPASIDDTASTPSPSAAHGELPPPPATTNSTAADAPSTSSNATPAAAALAAGAQASADGHAQAATAPNHVKQSGSAPKDAGEALPNGDAADRSGAESPHINGEAISGSDTDISRPGSVDPTKQDTAHARLSSMKKPAAFKSVSVTKSFLAKSAASTPSASPGLKPAPAVQPPTSTLLTAKPRLVAKSGAANTPRTLGKTNGAGAGPDASKVWNKNQPVPPPPPKQYTDEELKQQYGIHLATRLPMDEAGKEAKWADIDDDDGDWAPDTVEWMDGTKSSVTAPENQPPPPVEEPPRPTVLARPETAADAPKPSGPAPTSAPKQSVTGAPKTILKPGGHVQSGTTKTSLVLKGQPEKPTLVAKPSTGGPAKSPWAVLPPVEKASPLQMTPPTQQQPTNHRFSTQDQRAYEPMPPHPGREIAPDDFNRTWREERGGRELFNSQNGRYEPVNDARRGSFRDSGYRQQQHPSLLQRSSHDGPAEPSSAFQTSRSSGDMPSWGRRRTSSNVSGGPGRRMSFDRRGPEFSNAILDEEHQAAPSINGAEPASNEASRQSSLAQAASPHVTQTHPAAPQDPVPPPVNEAPPTANAAPTMEDQVEAQKRMMADKIERARLKKQQQLEAEKKEEEEKKARIAKRLAALGEAPKPKASEKSPSPAVGRSPQKVDAALAPVQSPPKPPVPSSDGEVAQYGMMKVHQSHPVKKPSPVSQPAKLVEPKPNAQDDTQVRLPLSLDAAPTLPFDSNRSHGRKAAEHSRTLAEGTAPQGTKPTQPAWQPGPGSQTRGGWTSQVWGSAQTRDRNLGNGMFDSGFHRGQPRSGTQQQLPTQPSSAPIAPIGVDPAPPSVSHTVKMPLSSQPIHPPSRQMPAQAVPGPIAPPSDNKWGNFAAHIARDDANMVVKARQDRDRMGGESFRPELRETYKDQRGKAQTVVHSTVAGSATVEGGANARVSPAGSELKLRDEAVKSSHDGSPQQPLVQGTPLQQTGGSRSSRFFPRPIETSLQAPVTASNKADSPPPPPETETHPVFADSVSGHPLVRLPRPSPVVRLPKPAQDPVDVPVSMPPRGHHGPGARPLAMNPEWQARFNKLLDKPAAVDTGSNARPLAVVPVALPARLSALAVAASSKASLDVRGPTGSATVSLPNAVSRKNSGRDSSRGTFTRDGTAALFEDREFGSLPTVRLPKVPHLSANEPAITLPKDDVYTRLIRKENPFTTKRLDAFDFGAGSEIDVIVRLAHMKAPITKTMPKPRRGKGNGPYNKPKRNGTPTGPQTGGPKERPRKPSQQGHGERTDSSPRVHLPSTWPANSRPTTTAPKRESWAQRAAAAAVAH